MILVQDIEQIREELFRVGLMMEAIEAPASGGGMNPPPLLGAGEKLAEYISNRKGYDAEIGKLQFREDSIFEERR